MWGSHGANRDERRIARQSSPAKPIAGQTRCVAADYSDLIAAVITVLKADAKLTGTLGLLAAYDPNGVSPSRSNSIFGENPPTAQPPTPCIVVKDVGFPPAARIAEEPTHYVNVSIVIYVFGASDAIRAVCWEVNEALRTAWWNNAMDTADWVFVNILSGQTGPGGGDWEVGPTGEQATDSNGVFVMSRFKTFYVKAVSTHS